MRKKITVLSRKASNASFSLHLKMRLQASIVLLCVLLSGGLSFGVLNGKKCYTCDWKDCSKTLSCWGNEDYCFSEYDGRDHTTVAKGCASKSVCDKSRLTLGPSTNFKCCEGNLCNGVNRVSQSFLFLCCSLLSFIILH